MSEAIAWRRARPARGRRRGAGCRDLGVRRAGASSRSTGRRRSRTAAAILGIVRAGAVAAPLPVGRTAPETAAALALLDPVLFLGPRRARRGTGGRLDGPGRRRADVRHDGRAEGRRAFGRMPSTPAPRPGSRRCRRRAAGCSRSGSRTWRGSACCGGPPRGRVPMRIVPPDDAAAPARGPARRPGDEPRLARPGAARAAPRRRQRRAATGEPAGRAPRRRDDPGGARDAGARRRLARRPDLRPERGGVRRDGARDGRGARGPRAVPAGRSPGSPSRSRTRTRTASARSSSTRPSAVLGLPGGEPPP